MKHLVLLLSIKRLRYWFLCSVFMSSDGLLDAYPTLILVMLGIFAVDIAILTV